jgi:transcriptional regulator with XRE-family HTH domain
VSEQDETIARNIQRLRTDGRLTIGELARRAGLSKQTLSMIERGGANPTIGTLTAIAEALGSTLRHLIIETGSTVVVRPAADAQWTSAVGGQARLLDQIYGSGYVRTTIVKLSGRDHKPSEVLYRGSLHHVFVIEGDVEAGPVARPATLSQGDYARFPADADHVIISRSESSLIHLVTTFPQIAQLPPVPQS